MLPQGWGRDDVNFQVLDYNHHLAVHESSPPNNGSTAILSIPPKAQNQDLPGV